MASYKEFPLFVEASKGSIVITDMVFYFHFKFIFN